MVWQQRARRLAINEEDRRALVNRHFLAQVTAVDGFREQARFVSPVGPSSVTVSHPFLSTNSWIRAIPESGTLINAAYEGSSRRLAMIGYGGAGSNEEQLRNSYQASQFPYRDMVPGEIEISSQGWAQAYFSGRGLLALRGGVVTSHLSHDRLESAQSAPTHVRQLHKHAPDIVGDEERYGVVKRPNPENASREIYVKTELEGGDERFAREYRRDLKPGGGAPNTLVEHVEGDVVSQEGEVETLPMTGLPLRARSRYYTPEENTLTISIDEEGNFQIQLPDDADEGGRMAIPEGGLRITVKKDIEMNTEQNIAGAAERKVTFDGERGIELTFTGARVVQGGTVNTDSVVTCNSVCPFLGGGNHLDGSARVAAEKGVPFVPVP